MSDMKWQNTRLMKTELKAKRCERCSCISRSRIMTDVSEHLVEQTRQNGGEEEED